MAGTKASAKKRQTGAQSPAAKRATIDKPNTIEVEFNLSSWMAATEESGAFKVVVQMRDCTLGGMYSTMLCLLESGEESAWGWVHPIGDGTIPVADVFVPVIERAIRADPRLWALVESVR